MARAIEWESRIGRRMRLRDLHVLLAVIQSGSMSSAAVKLGVSQPVVSDAIADLEATVGVRLLDRSRRGVVPTIYGQALLRRGQVAFDELRQGIREIEHLADPAVGEVRVGCPESLAAGVLPSLIEQFTRHHPRVRFQIAQVNTLNPQLEFVELRERKLDVVLARAFDAFDPREVAEDTRVERLLDDYLVVVAGRTSPWASRRKLTLAALLEAQWMLPTNSWNSLRMMEAFAAVGLTMPPISMDTFSLALRRELLATGRFVSAIPASTLRHDDALKVLPVDLPRKPWPILMVTLKSRTLGAGGAAFHRISSGRIEEDAPSHRRRRLVITPWSSRLGRVVRHGRGHD